MKRYRFASTEAMKTADLREYKDIILEAANMVIPKRKVKVYKNYYTVEYISRGEAIALGRILARTGLWEYHVDAPKVFIGEEMEE